MITLWDRRRHKIVKVYYCAAVNGKESSRRGQELKKHIAGVGRNPAGAGLKRIKKKLRVRRRALHQCLINNAS